MELKLNIDYNQILGLIKQLPSKEKKKLFQKLQKDITTEKTTNSIQDIILDAPTWSDSDFIKFKGARDHINNSRIA